jgi:hypothetical protein
MEVSPIHLEEVPVFARLCTACSRRQLIFPSQITGVVNTDHGIEVHYRCWCGAPQEFLTGNRSREGAEPRRLTPAA